jgi:hypothetical protein
MYQHLFFLVLQNFKAEEILHVIAEYLYLTFSHHLKKSVLQLMLPWKWATDILTQPSCTRMKQLLGIR